MIGTRPTLPGGSSEIIRWTTKYKHDKFGNKKDNAGNLITPNVNHKSPINITVTPLAYQSVTSYPGATVTINITQQFNNIKLTKSPPGWGSNFVVNTIHADGSIDVKIDSSVVVSSSYTLQMPYEVLNPLDNTKTIAGS